ncbi:hypothetical protein HYN59_00950 [Flavobacterium album]|uniref:Uncharacterized protein n=1 Tax=Flavobacterium album TaxID=2175091 RepID=A0A2S1QTS1_9FLAO|nr:hypothetical protein [Flavobacterium album]AWH83766.1 hypothetical protein HYN59_00950 [Flavobacterium album]
MTNRNILQSIANWNAIIKDGPALVTALGCGNRFSYTNTSYPVTSEYIHAYPGIYKNDLFFFLIPQAYDKKEFKSQISAYTQPCKVYWTLSGSHTIPDLEAKARMDRWVDNYKTWTPKQASDPVGMFKAFNIHADDFESSECMGTLGLQVGGDEGIMTADMIIANQNDKTLIQFDDYATPVPPYTSIATEESFYLLEASKLV